MFSRILTALVVGLLCIGIAHADPLELKPGQIVTEEDVQLLHGHQYEANLARAEADTLYKYWEDFSKSCGTAAKFKTDTCFKKFQNTMTAIRNNPE